MNPVSTQTITATKTVTKIKLATATLGLAFAVNLAAALLPTTSSTGDYQFSSYSTSGSGGTYETVATYSDTSYQATTDGSTYSDTGTGATAEQTATTYSTGNTTGVVGSASSYTAGTESTYNQGTGTATDNYYSWGELASDFGTELYDYVASPPGFSDSWAGTGWTGVTNDLTCSDSDGGDNLALAGTVALTDQANVIIASATDYCIGTSTVVREYSCNSQPNVDPQSYVFKDTPCGAGKICQNGACAPIPFICSETDAGADYNQKSTTTLYDVNNNITTKYVDVCYNTSTMHEFYCYNGSVSSSTIQCGWGATCLYGACTSVPFYCMETDAGADYNHKGTTTLYDVKNNLATIYNDVCYSSTSIHEFYCQDESVTSNTVRCDCSNGKCN